MVWSAIRDYSARVNISKTNIKLNERSDKGEIFHKHSAQVKKQKEKKHYPNYIQFEILNNHNLNTRDIDVKFAISNNLITEQNGR